MLIVVILMKKVLIIQRYLPHFRVEFFKRLKEECANKNIALSLVYGRLKGAEAMKIKEENLEAGIYAPVKEINFFNQKLFWHRCLQNLKGQDMIIVQQTNRELINYLLLLRRIFSKTKFAYIGHGRNMQVKTGSWRNRVKNFLIKKCDWWFAYNDNVKDYLTTQGYPPERITSFMNAIDTKSLILTYEDIGNAQVLTIKKELHIDSDNIGIFCGGLYKEKRINFLIEACIQIKSRIKDFHLIVLGSGVEEPKVRDYCEKFDWIHYPGPVHDDQRKAAYFKASKVFLLPGLVGLAILDSFAFQTPLITTDYPFHSPEIDYLKNEGNGIITKNNISEYVDSVVELLQNDTKMAKLIEGCRHSAGIYNLEGMVENFTTGIVKALSGQNKI
ncbi:MAG: glycosyltransferase family 4 protein [Leptolyngbya sp. SIO1D8]|nr:glycosyltransferase family 4 protein [Leptolyngbya sp. SIO1D8]